MCTIYYTINQFIYCEIIFLNISNNNRNENLKILETICSNNPSTKNLKVSRFYDNFVRIFSFVEDHLDEENVNDLVCDSFHITKEMTKEYLNLFFVAYYKIELKRRKFKQISWNHLHILIDNLRNGLTGNNKRIIIIFS